MIDALQNNSSVIDTSDLNFDFEDEIVYDSNTLGDKWERISSSAGHAEIANIRDMQPSDFASKTGYAYVGDDLSYQNKQSLILYTGSQTSSEYSTGYVGVRSQNINISAHGIYKISLKVKVASLEQGSFYLKVQESDNIYTVYPDLISSNKDDKNYLALQSGKTSGITSNQTNNFTNNYQTVELYVKGHSLYDTQASVELWLGDSDTLSQGCVVVDDIKLEYASYSDYSSASNKVEFASFSSSPSSISNGYFNASENDETKLAYPVKASSWTVTKESDKKNQSGIVYLYNSESYKNMYVGSYSWAGINPGNPNGEDEPNNVYMMHNSQDSYQSIKSSSYTLSSDSYYKLSFDYYNQNGLSGQKDSKINVSIVDENGITLFSKKGLTSINQWNQMNVLLHTSSTVSHNVQVIVSLGEEDDLAGGLVYLDNFVFETADQTAFDNALFKSDLTDYYLNLESNLGRNIVSTPAYTFSVDSIYNSSYSDDDKSMCGEGGIVSGQDNPYIDEFENLKLEKSNYLALSTKVASTITLTSNFSISLTSGSYYNLTFDLATIFGENAKNAKTSSHDCKYGLSVKVNGYEEVSSLITENELKSYSIYIKADSSTTPKISFSLTSDCDETLGTALITNLSLIHI